MEAVATEAVCWRSDLSNEIARDRMEQGQWWFTMNIMSATITITTVTMVDDLSAVVWALPV